jgi:hypothetical protein
VVRRTGKNRTQGLQADPLWFFGGTAEQDAEKGMASSEAPQNHTSGAKQAAEKRLFGLALFRSVWLFSELGLFGC